MGILNLKDVPPPLGAGDGDRNSESGPAAPEPVARETMQPPEPGGASAPSLFDTSALTEPAEPASAAAPAKPAPAIESDPVRTLELKPLIVEQLATVFDPEIPVNIYELGLIYDVDVNAGGLVGIRMTLTSPACPAAQTLPGEVKAKARAVPGVSDAWVDVVWEPQWDMNKMSDAAKLQLGLL
jgi:FeS assembly SUF system protein